MSLATRPPSAVCPVLDHEQPVGRGARPEGPGRGRPRLRHAPRPEPAASPTRSGSADEYVIRVNRQPNQRLRREASLGPLLPPEVGYPEIVAYGGQLGADWLIVRRRPRRRAQPALARDDRERAPQRRPPARRHPAQPAPVRTPADLPRHRRAPQLLAAGSTAPSSRCSAALDRAAASPTSTAASSTPCARSWCDTRSVIEPFDTTHLVHGDLHFENVLWDGRAITALLDFEWARPGPPTSTSTCCCASAPTRTCTSPRTTRHQTRAEDYADVPYWLAEDYPELFDYPAPARPDAALLHRLRRARAADVPAAGGPGPAVAAPPVQPARAHRRAASATSTGWPTGSTPSCPGTSGRRRALRSARH